MFVVVLSSRGARSRVKEARYEGIPNMKGGYVYREREASKTKG